MCCTNASCQLPGTEQAIQMCTPKHGEMAQPRSLSGQTFALHPVRLGAVSQPRRWFESYGFCRAKSFPVLSHWKFAEMVRRRTHKHGISYLFLFAYDRAGVLLIPWGIVRAIRGFFAAFQEVASSHGELRLRAPGC